MAKYCVEVGNQYCDNWLFPASGENLRGRWDYNRLGHLDVGAMHRQVQQAMASHGSSIPGLNIVIDTEERTLKIEDPLETTETGRKLWQSIRGVVAKFGNGDVKPREATTLKLDGSELSDDKLKSWAYWVSRGIRDGDCLPTRESDLIPSPEEIEVTWPGERLRDPYDTSTPREPRKSRASNASSRVTRTNPQGNQGS